MESLVAELTVNLFLHVSTSQPHIAATTRRMKEGADLRRGGTIGFLQFQDNFAVLGMREYDIYVLAGSVQL
jgi:hypothetical protein